MLHLPIPQDLIFLYILEFHLYVGFSLSLGDDGLSWQLVTSINLLPLGMIGSESFFSFSFVSSSLVIKINEPSSCFLIHKMTSGCVRHKFLFFSLFLQPPFTGGNGQKSKRKIVKDKIKLRAFLSSEAHSLSKGVNLLSRTLHSCFHVNLSFYQTFCYECTQDGVLSSHQFVAIGWVHGPSDL